MSNNNNLDRVVGTTAASFGQALEFYLADGVRTFLKPRPLGLSEIAGFPEPSAIAQIAESSVLNVSRHIERTYPIQALR